MIDFSHPEVIVTLILSCLGGLGTLFTLAWKKIATPLIKLCKNQDFFVQSVNEIKNELTTNGGSSLKDTIIQLSETCKKIDSTQKIIEQRTRASLHYSGSALFETDEEGRLIWSNALLCNFIPENGMRLEGYDWLTIINEDEREDVLQEFISCLDMNRRFSKVTKDNDNNQIRLLGYPYRINEEKHGGFLVSVSKTREV